MKFDEILKALSQDERRKAMKVAWLGAYSALAALLTRNGHPITEASIRRWRAKREQA